MENKKLQWGYYTVKVEWKDDDLPDLSYLVGKASDKRDDYIFDRKEGRLLGAYKEATVTVKWDDVPHGKPTLDEKGQIHSAAWDAAEAILTKKLNDLKIDEGDNPDYWHTVQWDGEAKEFYAEVSGYEILADNLGRTMGWHEFRYVEAGSNHLPHKPKSWSHVYPEEIAKVNAKYGSIEKADIAYAIEDWRRWERYGDWWCMMGCIVTVYKDGIEIASDSCWGIESDAGDEHHNSMIEEILGEALHKANISLPAKVILKEAKEWEQA